MALLMFTARIHDLQSSINRKQARLVELTRKLSDLQQYSANIADGNNTIFELVNAPASMFSRTLQYLSYSQNVAMMNANNKWALIDPMLQQQLQNSNMDAMQKQQYYQMYFQDLLKQERAEIQKREEKYINQQEKEIEQEKTKVETSLKMDQTELESAQKAQDEGIKAFAPKYVAG